LKNKPRGIGTTPLGNNESSNEQAGSISKEDELSLPTPQVCKLAKIYLIDQTA